MRGRCCVWLSGTVILGLLWQVITASTGGRFVHWWIRAKIMHGNEGLNILQRKTLHPPEMHSYRPALLPMKQTAATMSLWSCPFPEVRQNITEQTKEGQAWTSDSLTHSLCHQHNVGQFIIPTCLNRFLAVQRCDIAALFQQISSFCCNNSKQEYLKVKQMHKKM